jgi:hypothetical protein
LDFLVDVLDADVFDVLALFVFLAFFAMAHLLRDVIGRQRGEKTRGSFSAAAGRYASLNRARLLSLASPHEADTSNSRVEQTVITRV